MSVIFFAVFPYTFVHASILSSFAEKFKNVFVVSGAEDEKKEEDTPQTMEVFKPVIVDSSSTDENYVLNGESLQVVSGTLRVSTEDIDFPLSDTVSVYEVKKGDTIEAVAKLFSVSVNTIIWANNLTSKKIKEGDVLVILPITGIKHNVKKGDTINTIAKKYKADTFDIATYNGLAIDSNLAVGDTIIVPDGEIEIVAPKKTIKKSNVRKTYANSTPQGFLIRPVNGGRRSQGLHGNNGVDIASTPGTPILASGSGKVIVARKGGYNGGYGSMIIISHNGGIQTLYAHLRDVYVTQGQEVSQGETIGEMGNTGRSTGPHLHFEVRGAKNPF